MIVITQKKMQAFKSAIKTATNATNATCHTKSIGHKDDITNLNATNAIAEGGISGIKKTKAPNEKQHQLTIYDICGVSGVSSEKKLPLRTSTWPDEVEI